MTARIITLRPAPPKRDRIEVALAGSIWTATLVVIDGTRTALAEFSDFEEAKRSASNAAFKRGRTEVVVDRTGGQP